MRVVALISGGKDSCYNMMQCIAAGHQIVALANLRPDENQVGSDELDSYMYQTVGHQAIDLYAEAMALPLYRRTIRGRSLVIGQVYTKCEGDEVEDLYELLKLVKEKEEVDGISVGAILSDYQHARVQNVCKRLNLQLLAYLWQRNQEDLLREMIASNIQAVIIKVAALATWMNMEDNMLNKPFRERQILHDLIYMWNLKNVKLNTIENRKVICHRLDGRGGIWGQVAIMQGLDPDKHLGKTLDEMEPYLLELSKKYGVHVCGEGGEYETFTLDCPLFKKKIIVDSSEVVVHSADAFAPVAYLRFLELHLEDKVSPEPDNYKTSTYIHNF
ncbi:diphthine--ammonia ligase isoform X2 [Marmota marmota marmota]|uniref:diphthine--ammonia ligase isoform X2 n=1 Tax=Marmota marmota marmota TaxID=9994 RepID=UPI002093B6A9|nr:diphthine--ammonia ligase isoform X2 [Marmota marmota marmota]